MRSVLGLAAILGACTAARPSAPSATPPTTAERSPAEAPGLHNVVAYGPGLWSGSLPQGDAGFTTLRAWGIRTVISVDGAEPDLARAQAAGGYVAGDLSADNVAFQKTTIAKLDWNALEGQRVSFTYRKNEGETTSFANYTGSTTTSLKIGRAHV